MAEGKRDPWADVTTRHGFAADEVISGLQKEIRRGKVENAVLLGYEMITTSPEMEAYLWRRLMVISVEDIGMGDPFAPVLIANLHRITEQLGTAASERLLFALHAIRYLASREKDRSSDELTLWVKRSVEGGDLLPSIPDYALDMHTRRGQEMGRGFEHFMAEGSLLQPELEDRDRTYLERLTGGLKGE